MKGILIVVASGLIVHPLHADIINIYNATNETVAVALVQIYNSSAPADQQGKLYSDAKKYAYIVQTIEPKRYAALKRPSFARKVDTILIYGPSEEVLTKAIRSGSAKDDSGVALPFYKVGQVSNTKLVAFKKAGFDLRIDQEKKVRYTLPDGWYKNETLLTSDPGLEVIINVEQINKDYAAALVRRNER